MDSPEVINKKQWKIEKWRNLNNLRVVTKKTFQGMGAQDQKEKVINNKHL
jgi:hypothetical protein